MLLKIRRVEDELSNWCGRRNDQHKAVLFDEKAQVLDSYKELYQLYRDGNGMAEQNPDDLTAAVEKVIHDALIGPNH